MNTQNADNYAIIATLDSDAKNLARIERALAEERINDAATQYLTRMYSASMDWFREVFHVLGTCLGAPKTSVMEYDYESNRGLDADIRISDIHPLKPYLVQHRLDADPMRNQFFDRETGHKIELSVSSIVTVIVGAQKKIDRALEKITGKYYTDYVNEVADTAYRVIAAHERESNGRAIADKIRDMFGKTFITDASSTVLGIIGGGHEKISADLVRALDMVRPPHMRLQDVWRVKCLFDLVPQARTFIERIRAMMPERILSVSDRFYDMKNPRNYRDAKIIINIGTADEIVPMEIICQVRTFFEFERQTHAHYEISRKKKCVASDNIERQLADFMEQGVKEYNLKICRCLDDLFDRVGWNILYAQGGTVSMFDGFPKNCKLYYPQRILDLITEKLDDAIENEVFRITNAPAKLTRAQESEIFHFMARFVLVAAMPYPERDWAVPRDTLAGRFFNFVMTEVQRYYKKT